MVSMSHLFLSDFQDERVPGASASITQGPTSKLGLLGHEHVVASLETHVQENTNYVILSRRVPFVSVRSSRNGTVLLVATSWLPGMLGPSSSRNGAV